MPVRPIVTYPSKILREKCLPVDQWTVSFPQLLSAWEDMEDTLEESDRGAALAANQISLRLRMFVTNQSLTHEMGMETTKRSLDPIVYSIPPIVINPRITTRSQETEILDEACLSFPGFGMKVKRHRSVEATYDTLVRDSAVDGGWRWEHIVQAYEGFWAQVFQHEIDHLDGKLFVDALPERKRIEIANFIRKKR